jgi:hypothetical protein
MCLYWKKSFKIFFSITSKPILIKLGTNDLCIKVIEVCTNKGQILFKGEIITKIAKNRVRSSKMFILKNHKARKTKIYMYIKASRYSADSR